MGLVLLGLIMYMDNQEFIATKTAQIDDGYKWHYVGKTKPSGVPAFLTEDTDGNKVIYYKLKR